MIIEDEKVIFEKKVKDSLIIMLNKNKIEYFGIIFYGLEKEILSMKEYCSIISIPSLAFTDGKKITFLSNNITVPNVIATAIHEIIHIISLHLDRRGTRDPEVWQIAADHVTNRTIKLIEENSKYVKLPDGLIYLDDLEKAHPNLDVERVYDLLINNKNFMDSIEKIDRYADGDGDSEDGSDSDKNSSDKTKSFKIVRCKDGVGSCDVCEIDDEIQNNLDELRNKADVLWKSNAISKGDMPGDLTTYLDKIFEVEIPWHIILETSIMYYSQTCDEPSWSQKNIYLPGIKVPGYVDGKENISLVVAIDSSGSITDEDLKKFIGILLSSMKYFKKLIVYVHDVTIKNTYIFENDFSQDDLVRQLSSIMGRGGTSHEYIFNEIEQIYGDELISNIIFLTDYYSDVQHIYKKYNWIKSIPTIWILNSKQEVVLEECETRVIHI